MYGFPLLLSFLLSHPSFSYSSFELMDSFLPFFVYLFCSSVSLSFLCIFFTSSLKLLHQSVFLAPSNFLHPSIFLDPSHASQVFLYPWMMVAYSRWTLFHNSVKWLSVQSIQSGWQSKQDLQKNRGKKKEKKKEIKIWEYYSLWSIAE